MGEPAGVRVLARAKLNLFLRVLAREASGYHSLETLFTLIDLADEITVSRANGTDIRLTVEGEDTGPPQDNLVTRAAQLISRAIGRDPALEIRLVKRIPVRAGLGGGSSDAAATLHAVNALFGQPVPRHEILQLAAQLGSDVPFFAAQAPLALAWGRGERLFRLAPLPAVPGLLLVPPVGVSTPDAYALLDKARGNGPGRGSVALDPEAFSGWGSIARLGGNDFESVIFAEQPALREAFEAMASTRPLLLRMSGSGSAIAGLYRGEAERDEAVGILSLRLGRTIRITTLPQILPQDSEFL